MTRFFLSTRRTWRRLAATLIAACPLVAAAALGVTELAPRGGDGPVTVFYPTDAAERPFELGRGAIRLAVARDAAPSAAAHGGLVMVSHGSGGSPWVHADLARALVDAGYTVAVAQHAGDSYRDDREPGPASWQRRPAELSRAIDAVAADPRFGPRLDTSRVGVFGMSAGGHTALVLAGGRWSPARFAAHCQQHLADDFNACVGLATALDGGWLDGVKLRVARTILASTFGGDATDRGHGDPRIAAVVAAVPHAASFDPASLAQPRVPLALATAAGDVWLHPRFHSTVVQRACAACTSIDAPPAAGHGAYLSPLPAIGTAITGLAARLLADPPGFDRSSMTAVDATIVGFFDRTLRAAPAP